MLMDKNCINTIIFLVCFVGIFFDTQQTLKADAKSSTLQPTSTLIAAPTAVGDKTNKSVSDEQLLFLLLFSKLIVVVFVVVLYFLLRKKVFLSTSASVPFTKFIEDVHKEFEI